LVVGAESGHSWNRVRESKAAMREKTRYGKQPGAISAIARRNASSPFVMASLPWSYSIAAGTAAVDAGGTHQAATDEWSVTGT
jgi:hypothetical protein